MNKLGHLGRTNLDVIGGRMAVARHTVDTIVCHNFLELGGALIKIFGNLGDEFQDDSFNLVDFILFADDAEDNINREQ
ncbi:hypothetical protein D1872_334460 [compost metagenome]